MYILTVAGKEREGAYSVKDERGIRFFICLKKRMMLYVML